MQDFAGPSTECSKIWSWKKSARCSTIHAVWCQKIYTLDCYSPGNFIRITISHSKVAWKNSPDHCMILDDFGTFWYSTYWIFLSAFQRVTGPSPEASAHLVQFAPAVTCWINTLGDEPELVMSGSSTHRIHVCYIYIYGNILPSIYPGHVSIYTSAMDPSWGIGLCRNFLESSVWGNYSDEWGKLVTRGPRSVVWFEKFMVDAQLKRKSW